jgi:hypothetical protein
MDQACPHKPMSSLFMHTTKPCSPTLPQGRQHSLVATSNTHVIASMPQPPKVLPTKHADVTELNISTPPGRPGINVNSSSAAPNRKSIIRMETKDVKKQRIAEEEAKECKEPKRRRRGRNNWLRSKRKARHEAAITRCVCSSFILAKAHAGVSF